MELTEDHVQ